MPRIDPLSLLKCLSVLLGPAGGIKSEHEVPRLANLMTKFSKKLVSKCIYIQILKTTSAELLSQFMGAGGWNLIHMWLTDGIVAKNWALIQELLELLLLCPVDIERLKSNNCPKLIKGLSKEGSQEAVQVLAGRLVEQWLKMVKDAAAPNSVPPQIPVNQQITTMGGQQQQQQQQITAVVTSGQPRHQIVDGSKIERHDTADNSTTIKVQDLNVGNSSSIVQETGVTHHIVQNQQQFQDQIHIQPVQLQIINKTMPGQSQPTQIKKQSFVVVSSASSSHSPSVPVYKITIRDGKQVLTKVETDATNITNIFNDSVKKIELNGEIKQEIIDKVDSKNDIASISECRTFDENDSNNVSDKVSCEVKQMSIICKNENQNDVSNVKNENDLKDIVGSDGNNKSSDKENRDSYKKDDKSSSSSSSDNKKSSSHSSSKSSSKHGSSSSSRSSSHKSSSHRSSSKSSSSSSKSSRNKDKHGSSSSNKHSSSSSSSKSKSDRDKERDKEKEKIKKDQAEKDKATLEKVQAPLLGTRFGKIPKKKPEDEKTAGSDPLRKSSTDSRDSSKENKDKGDSKKSSPSTQGVLEKKNISVSIENKKNSQDTVRPKTVKTFNSKFRSTGLEEEVKPPPPRSTAAKKAVTPIDKKIILPKLSSLKRVSPLRETGATPEKKAKIALDNSVTSLPEDTKKGAIKLIPPKPKPMVLQESDMFMDALMTASTKNKEPRKRKRRTSISKDTDTKKSDGSNSMSDSTHDASPATSSPSGGDERSSLSIKPDFKFYQDTLETDEDKEDKDRSQDDKDDESLDEKIRNRMDEDDDERSRTPTCDDDSQDARAPASPDDPEDTGRKVPSSPNAEIRYVDGLRSVLLLQKRKGPKKNLKWKTELESVRYFELDETERVNVTKTFTDMKQMEKQNEREAFQMARKLSTEDLMAERTRWKILIPIDLPTPLVEPGKDSKEKEIQYAREKGILQALYFNRGMIPDSPAEPDEERHHIFTDPKIIPLDDLTGNKDSEKDFTTMAWPEPKPQLSPIPPVTPNVLYPPFPQHNQTQMPGLPLPPSGMVPMAGGMTQQMPTMMPPMNHMSGGVQDVGSGAGGWRTGDGKVVVPDLSTMNNIPSLTASMPTGYPPPIDTSMMPPSMMPPPGMYNQDGYPGMIPSEDGSYGHMPNNFQGPGMFVSGPNFPGGPPPPRGAVINPMHGANRGRGGPGWFRGGIGPMRNTGNGGNGGGGGGGGGGANWGGRGGWRGNGKQPPVCRQFTKNGYCRVGDKCQYLHPGVNCPPF